MQGVVRSFDPGNGEGVVVATDGGREEYLLAADALEGSIFRMLRQGQRVNFDVDGSGLRDPDADRRPRSTWDFPPTSRCRTGSRAAGSGR